MDHAPHGAVIVVVVVMVLIVRLVRVEIWVSLTGIAWEVRGADSTKPPRNEEIKDTCPHASPLGVD